MRKPINISVSTVLFGLLSIMLFCNLNGILKNFVGINAGLSPVILVLCFCLLAITRPTKKLFSYPFIAFLSTLLSLWYLGFISGLIHYDETNFKNANLFFASRLIFTSCLIFYVFSSYISTLNREQKSKHIKFVFYLFFFTSSIGVLESLFGFRTVAVDMAYDKERTLGFFGNPNLTGLQANFSLVFIIGLFLSNKLKVIPTLLLIPVVTYAAGASFSKTAIITAALLLISFLLICIWNLFRINHRQKVFRSFSVIAILSVVSFAVIVPIATSYYDKLGGGQQERLLSIVDLVAKGQFNRKTSSMRSEIFKDGIEVIKDDVILGHGLSTFSIGGMFKSSPTHGVHNMYLKLIGEAGIIPLFLFFSFFITFTLRALKKQKREYLFITLFTIISFFVFCFTSHNALEDKFSVALIAILVGVLSDD